MKLWSCNFNAQLANALIIEGDYQSSIAALECGYVCATQISYPELQVFFFPLRLQVIIFSVIIVPLIFYLYVFIWTQYRPHSNFLSCCCASDVLCNFRPACAPHAMGR